MNAKRCENSSRQIKKQQGRLPKQNASCETETPINLRAVKSRKSFLLKAAFENEKTWPGSQNIAFIPGRETRFCFFYPTK